MTVAQQGSPILDPDLRSQPLREAACHGLCPLSDSDATLGTEGRRRRPLREYSRPADWYLLPLAILTKRTEILR